MVKIPLHVVVSTAIAGLLLGLSGCSKSGTNAAENAASVPAAPVSYTVSLSTGQPATIAQEQLSLRLTDVKDSRCAVGVQCVWAGHATVTVLVGKAGGTPESLVLGTEAPVNLKLPYQAVYGAYTLTLSALEPRPTQGGGASTALPVATIQVTKG